MYYFCAIVHLLPMILVKCLCTGLLIGVMKPPLFMTDWVVSSHCVRTKKAIKAVREIILDISEI